MNGRKIRFQSANELADFPDCRTYFNFSLGQKLARSFGFLQACTQQTSARMAGLRLHLAACTTPSSLNFWRMNTPERLAVVFVMTVNLPPRADEAADYR